MLVLTLDAALATGSAGLVADGRVLDERLDAEGRGSGLPALVAAMLPDRAIDLVAVTVGPGGFTGLRAALALGHGVGLALDVPVQGVTVGAAMAHAAISGRALWTAIDSKRGRVFLEVAGRVVSVALDDLPDPGPVGVCGDAAAAVVAALTGRGIDALLLDCPRPTALGIALAVTRGDTVVAQPLYADPPEARPAASVRPSPL